jgi:predicted acyl esterase
VPEDTLSHLAKQEGPDPAYWCHYGYAVINPDPRGVANSEGDIQFLSETDFQDCYDFIEWTSNQYWCNGKVTMHGTAFAGVSAWFAAALRPPHLACIAPWEAFYDTYRAIILRGGILDSEMLEHVLSRLRGNGAVEDIVEMARQYPLMNGYWDEKRAKLENIEIPVYVTANYNLFHQMGMDAFRRLPTQKKWLRVHNAISWRDLYMPENLEDLRRFFDRYLKDIHNGWEFTPPVRLSVYDSAGDVVNRPEAEWPPARTQHEKLFLDAANGTLSTTPVKQESTACYTADSSGEVAFAYTFDQDAELVGYATLRLWVESEGANDMDLFVSLQRFDAHGAPLTVPWSGQPHGGLSGMLRVSHRELDETRSTPSEPYLAHRCQLPLKPGEIVPVDIPLWPLGCIWHEGEQLRVVVTDQPRRSGAGAALMKARPWELVNQGKHIFHTGGKYDSYLLVPVLPGVQRRSPRAPRGRARTQSR